MDANVAAAMLLAFVFPVVAIGAGIFNGWLKRRHQQKVALGAAKLELDRKVERLEQSNAEMARRLENLETIVVSQTWSTVHAPAAVAPHEVQAPAAEEMNRQRAEQLARRLGG